MEGGACLLVPDCLRRRSLDPGEPHPPRLWLVMLADISEYPITARTASLADALEEAGCDDVDVLTHCRGPGLHVRGCWVVDRVLGKE